MKGITLIEVLVVMAISTIAGVLLVVIIVQSASLYTDQSVKVKRGLSINDALLKIRDTVKQAGSVAENYTNGGSTYTSGPGQLVLKVASVDPDGKIIGSAYDNFVVLLDQKILRFKSFPDPSSSRRSEDRVLADSADNLLFEYFNSASPPIEAPPFQASKVRVSLTIKGAVATSEAYLRND